MWTNYCEGIAINQVFIKWVIKFCLVYLISQWDWHRHTDDGEAI